MPNAPAYVTLQQLLRTEFAREDFLERSALDALQFRRALSQVILRLTPAAPPTGPWFDALFAELDTNFDGLIDFESFEEAAAYARQALCHSIESEWQKYAHDVVVKSKQQDAKSKDRLQSPAKQASFGARFDVVSEVGSGAFGRVLEVVDRQSGEHRACKIIELSENRGGSEAVEMEVSLLKALDHVGLLQLYEVFVEPPARVAILTELCAGGSLTERLDYHRQVVGNPMPEPQVAVYAEQILAAAGYCHQRGIVHRDLKPDNILFATRAADSPLKVIDFGLADTMDRLQQTQRIELAPRDGVMGAMANTLASVGFHVFSTEQSQTSMQRAGTPHFMAPEVYRGQYDAKADVWSIGCIAFEMVMGQHPFLDLAVDNYDSLRQKILQYRDSYLDSAYPYMTSQCAKLVQTLLRQDPRRRVSAAQALKDPFFASVARRGEALNHVSAKSSWKGLKSLAASPALRELALRAITRELQEEQVQPLRNAFLVVDKDLDGILSSHDLYLALGRNVPEQEIQEVMTKIGSVSMIDGVPMPGVGYMDYVAALLPYHAAISHEQLSYAFLRLDFEGTGRISLEGLSSRMAPMKVWDAGMPTITPALLERARTELRDAPALQGTIDFAMFCRLASVAGFDPEGGEASM